MSKQARTLAIIVGAAAATLLSAFAGGNPVLYGVAGIVLVSTLATVVVLVGPGRHQAREDHRRRHPSGLGSSRATTSVCDPGQSRWAPGRWGPAGRVLLLAVG